ncbi:hypothetical protein D1007_47633 [Hordeum vulgare]|nr:hypothetical protein D1007_47633 [Hordeum vulgare]
MEGDADKSIDELDKENFSKGKSDGSGNKVEVTCVCAASFHPVMMNDEVHEQFIEEVEAKTPPAHVEGSIEYAEVLLNQEDMDIGSHWNIVLPISGRLRWMNLREKMKLTFLRWCASLET